MAKRTQRPRELAPIPSTPSEPKAQASADRVPVRWWVRLLPWVWLLPCLAAAVAYRCVADFEFAADARMLILENRFLHDPQGAWAQVTHDYFWSSSGSIIPYWRPFTKLSWWCEWQTFGPVAGRFLFVSVAWHLLAVAGLFKLARTLGGSPWQSAIPATLLALHPVAIEPVALLMARSDTVAAACILWSVIAWRRWLHDVGSLRWAWFALHLAAAVLALATKEAAVVLPVVLLAWTALVPEAPASLLQRFKPILPSAALAAVYLIMRHHVLAAEHPDLPSMALDPRPLRLFASFASYLVNTFPLSLSSSIRDLPLPEASSAWFLARGAVVWGALVAAAIRSYRRDRVSLALIAWMIAAIAPVVLTRDISVPAGPEKLPLADRWLYHGLAPALLVWTRLAEPLLRTLLLRRAAVGVCAAWCAWILVRSTPDRNDLRNELGMLDNEDRVFYFAIPPQFRSSWDECRFAERKAARAQMQGDAQASYEAARSAMEPCGRTPERVADLLDAAVRTGRVAEAEALADEALASPPRDPRGHARVALDAGLTYNARGRAAEAEKWLATSLSLGMDACALPWVPLAEAARARKDVAEAATRLENAYACGGRTDPSLLLAAATWLSEVRDFERVSKVLSQAEAHQLASDQAAQAAFLRKLLPAR